MLNRLLFTLAIAWPLVACAPAAGQSATPAGDRGAAGDAAPSVVVSHSILGDIARNVLGDASSLTVLVPAGADAHTYEPSPADLTALYRADLIIENGLGFERWLDRIYASSGSKARRVVATSGVAALGIDGETHDEPADEPGPAARPAATDETGLELDPHVWHDVKNAVLMTNNVRDALVDADPARADRYRANAERYAAELAALDSYVVEQTEQVPAARRKLVTSHDTFRYFGHRYGFEIVGTAFGAATTEAADPTAGQLAALVQRIRAAGVPVIFAENVQDPGLMQRIAREAGVSLGPTLYTDALGEPGSRGDTYAKLIRSNVDTIVGALHQ